MSTDEIRTDEDLRYWLANEDWYMSSHTRRWLENTPPEEAAETLLRLASSADRERGAGWARMATAIATAGFSPSGAIAGKGPALRKAGVRATLMLANNLNDTRAIPPLVRSFEADSSRQGQYQELIEPALLRLISDAAAAAGEPDQRQYTEDVRDLAERAWNASDAGGRDLSPLRADLLIAALRYLAPSGEAADLALLRAFGNTPVKKPNRARVRDAALSLLENTPRNS